MPSDVERLLPMQRKQSGKSIEHRIDAPGYVSGGDTLGGTSRRQQVLNHPLRSGMSRPDDAHLSTGHRLVLVSKLIEFVGEHFIHDVHDEVCIEILDAIVLAYAF